jgi:hypothetical protein
LADEGIHRLGPDRVRWEVRLANRGEDVIVVRLELAQPHPPGLTLSAPEPTTISLQPGAEKLVAVEATLSDELLREPQQLSGQRVSLTAVPVLGGESADTTCPALALYLGCLEPGPHPWLFFSEEDIPVLRAKLEGPPLAELWADYPASSGAERRYYIPDDSASSAFERSMYGLLWALDAGAFSYRVLRNGRCLEPAKQNLAMAIRAKAWTSPGQRQEGLRADPLCGNVARVVATAYDWLYGELTEGERGAVREALTRQGIDPVAEVLAAGLSYPATRANHNWCGVVHGGAGVAALALLGEEPRAPRWIALMLERVAAMLDAGGRDGGWTEGPTYWEYGFSFAFQFMDGLKRATGGAIDLFKRPYCQQTGAFGLYTRVSDFDAVTFGDGRRSQYDSSVLVKLAAEFDSPPLQWAALNRRSAAVHPFGFIWCDPDVPAELPRDWPLAKHFRGIDWAFMRTGWGPDARVLALRSGRRDGHSHLDANSFILEALGQPMMVDVGPGSYRAEYFSAKTRWNDPATRTQSHNTILINADNQIPGEDGGHIATFSTSEHFDYVLADATSTYEGANKVLRHLLFVRPAYFVIYDEVETQQPAEVAFSLYRDRDETRRELQDGTVAYDWEKASLLVKVLQPAGASFEPAGEVKRHRCDRLTHPKQTTRCDLLVLLYPLPAAEGVDLPSIAATREGATIVVQVKRPRAWDTIRIGPTEPAATIVVESRREDGLVRSFSSADTKRITRGPTRQVEAE